jgi:hypothetical protein
MRLTALVVALFLLTSILTAEAMAFGTVTWVLGQNREHERITRKALSCSEGSGVANCFQPASIDEVAGRFGTMGAVGAPDNQARKVSSMHEAHCDTEDGLVHDSMKALYACQHWMETHMQQAVLEARAMLKPDGTIDDSQMPTIFNCTYVGQKGRAKCNVLEEFGLVLHAAQDFYSHTNWTDLRVAASAVTIENPQGLGNDGPAPFIDLSPQTPVFPMGLISGCFGGWPEAFHCNGKTKHAYLNKDKGTIDPDIGAGTTDRAKGNNNFARAAKAAILDTRDKWAVLQQRLKAHYGEPMGSLMICALSHDDPATTCQAAQQSKSFFKLFMDVGVFIAAAGLLGAGYFFAGRSRRRRQPA